MEKGRAEKQSKPGTNVFTPSELGLRGKKTMKIRNQMLALMKMAQIDRMEVPTDFPAGLYEELKKGGGNISLHKKSVCPERIKKSPAEVRCIRDSQRAAAASMKAAISLIASAKTGPQKQLTVGSEPLTSERVRRLIHKILIDHDCAGVETIVAGGDQGTDPHERGAGPLYGGQSIIIDIFPKSEKTGYWGDMTRTVCRGPASPELKNLYNAVKAAQAAGLRAVKPGICADEVHAAAKTVFEKRGYETKQVDGRHVGFIHGTGHGVGLDIHEFPRVSGSGEILAAGNIITVEPGLYYPGLGGVRIEDTVVVTEKGWRYLAPCEKKFELL